MSALVDLPARTYEVNLAIGDYYFGKAGTRISTLLGSCVAVTFWHPQLRVGGMCHALLPGRRERGRALDGKYTDEAVELLLRALAPYKRPLHEFQVKLFGAGNMFPDFIVVGAIADVACRNAHAAREISARLGLNVIAEDLGGLGHRKVLFDLASGDVWVRQDPLRRPPVMAAALPRELHETH